MHIYIFETFLLISDSEHAATAFWLYRNKMTALLEARHSCIKAMMALRP